MASETQTGRRFSRLRSWAVPRMQVVPAQQLLRRGTHDLLRVAAVLVVLCAAFLSYRVLAGSRAMQLLVLAYFAGLAALFLLRFPAVGLIGIIVAALLVPFAIGTGTQTAISGALVLLAGMVGLWLFDMLVRQRRIGLLPSRSILPLLLLNAIAVVAFGFGQLPWLPINPAPIRAQLGGVAVFLFSGAAFLLTAHQIKKPAWLAWMTWVFLIIGAVNMLQYLAPIQALWPQRILARSSTGSLFWIWMVSLSAGQALFNQRLRPPVRALIGGLTLLTLYVAVVLRQYWLSGWLPPLAALAVIVAARWPRLGLLAIPVVASLALIKSGTLAQIVLGGDNQYSYVTRLEAWRIVFEIARISPVFGLGPANYYWYTPLIPILGYAVQFNSHSNYVDIIAQTGLAGLVFFLWFVWETGRIGWRLRSSAPEGFERAFIYGALGGLAGMLVAAALGDWVLPFVYNVGVDGMRASILGWLFLGGMISVEARVKE